MDDSAAPNPYQPPLTTPEPAIVAETDWAAMPHGRIAFAFTLNQRDIRRLFPSPFPSSLLIAAILIVLLLTLQSVSRGLLIVAIGVVVVMLLIRMRLNWSLAIRQSPRLLKPVHGYIAPSGVFTASDGCQGYSRWEDLFAIKTTKQAMLISGENWRLVSLIVPWTAFDQPDAARQAVQSVIEQRKNWRPLNFGDQRLRQPPVDAALFEADEPAVDFDGNVTFAEIAATEPGKKLRRNLGRWIPVCIVILIIALVTLWGGWRWILLAAVPLTVFAATILYILWRHPLVGYGADKVAFRTRGWFSASGFFIQSRTGQSLRQWHSVDHQWHDDSLLCICLPGISEGWFFFSRNQFASDDDFKQACQWCAAGLD
jgi:hypothetical protein